MYGKFRKIQKLQRQKQKLDNNLQLSLKAILGILMYSNIGSFVIMLYVNVRQ